MISVVDGTATGSGDNVVIYYSACTADDAAVILQALLQDVLLLCVYPRPPPVIYRVLVEANAARLREPHPVGGCMGPPGRKESAVLINNPQGAIGSVLLWGKEGA